MKRFFQLLFMPCEGISGLASEGLDRDLTRSERFAVWMHGLYCRACRHYRRQVLVLRQSMQIAGDELPETSNATLSPEARRRILDELNRE